MMTLLVRKWRSYGHLSAFSKFWLAPIWLLLGVSKALIFTIRFQRLATRLGQPVGVAPWVPLVTPPQQARALQIGRAVRLAAKYTPWDSNCFPQAVVARLLLGWYGVPYALYFGLARDAQTRETQAHAWVMSGPVAVTGGHSFAQFTVVGVFATPGLISV